MRVMAIQMDNNLFEEFKAIIKESGKTQKAFVVDMVQRELDTHRQQQAAEIDEEKSVKWERENVVQAIDDFLIQNNRVPSQKEFRSDNGLPSYNAAQRCLEQSPAEYCNSRLDELQSVAPEQEQSNDFSLSI